jgi:tetratricopeptide (TPR) repeat protein
VNSNQLPAACDAFDKAIAADPNYADAYYQRGMCLTAKATNTADGKVIFPPGTGEAFQKYLELKPDGANAESAKGMLSAMGQTIQTQYVAPGAKPAPAKKKK